MLYLSSRQLIIYSLIALLIIGLGVGGWLILRSGKKTEEPPVAEALVQPQVRQLTDVSVLSPKLSPEGKVLYYRKADGNIFSLDPATGQINRISDAILENLQTTIWGPLARQVISIFFLPGGNFELFHYSFATKQATSLPNQIRNPVFNNFGQKIAYQFLDRSKTINALSIADPQNQNFQKVLDLEFENPQIFWLQNKIGLITQSDGRFPGSFLLIDPQTKEKQTLLAGIYGLSAKASPSGTKILFSETNSSPDQQLNLNLLDINLNQIVNLKLVTFPEKCAWSLGETLLYCAVPENLPASTILPNHWRQGALITRDTLWQIDLKELKGKQLTLAMPYDVGWIKLTPDNLGLVFQDKTSGKLYRIELP
jgi:hypothetical protein